MGMKPWERDIIEYRPNIEFRTSILSVVASQLAKEDLIYQPTEVVKEVVKNPGFPIVEKLISSLSKGNQLLKNMEQDLMNYKPFLDYQEAIKNDDFTEARRVHLDNVRDINGHPSFDPYPIVKDLVDEMEDFLDFVIDELFIKDDLINSTRPNRSSSPSLNEDNEQVITGRPSSFDSEIGSPTEEVINDLEEDEPIERPIIDYNNLEDFKKKEEDMIESVVIAESKDLRFDKTPEFTPQQMTLIQRVIQDENNDIRSVDDYINYIRNERRRLGSPNVNYDYLADRVQTIYVLSEKADMFDSSINRYSSYINQTLSSYVKDDIQGSLEYLTSIPGSLNRMRESTQIAHQYRVMDAVESIKNADRISDRKFREYLDKKLSEIREKKRNLVDSLRYSIDSTDFESEGVFAVQDYVTEGIRAVNHLWKFILTEHFSTTELNLDQQQKISGTLDIKKGRQMMYHYIDLIGREFDFEFRDEELNTFASRQQLNRRKIW